MAKAEIPVDLFNPGQVFACLGFVEAAGVLVGGARGGFDWQDPDSVRFRLAADGSDDPIVCVLQFLDEACVASLSPVASSNRAEKKWKIETIVDESGAFPFPDPMKSAKLPACLTDNAGRSIVISHWGDERGKSGRDNMKFWSGSGGCPGAGLARDALELIRSRGGATDKAEDPFSLSAEQSSSFRFDWRRDYVPIDVGFSPNKHDDVKMRGYPIVELLATIGLTHARSRRHNKLRYSYGVAGLIGDDLYDPIFLRAALGGTSPPLPGMPFRLFAMQLNWPGQENQARCITNVTEEDTPS